MEKQEKLDEFYDEPHHFKNEVAILRTLALACGMTETYKWSFPTYMVDNKNIIAINKFKNHFGIWFFNGVFLSDSRNVLENAQEGKTMAMRHWKFSSLEAIDKKEITAYLTEAIENHKKGLEIKVNRKPKTKIVIPTHLSITLENNEDIKNAFNKLTYSKQKDYAEYIATAKQEKTKLSRLEKIVPLILAGRGIHDIYRKNYL
ncbi:YdeI/OmpD-associated family protein [Maribacter sp. IgM3_T14_3]|uniref:YdeI/OmpD-associated family protein n=1 Tax=Maribacter sp. IgM3_T14_3 TaxID=3415140 RepID=UPI003C6F2415